MSDYLRLAGVDPGFANIGLCAVDLYAIGGCNLVATKIVTTAPGKGKVNQIDDEIRRLGEIEDAVLEFVADYKPDVIAMEEPGKCLMKRMNPVTKRVEWVTNSAKLRSVCLMWGALHGIGRTHGIYTIKVGSQAIKKALCANKSASKKDVVEAVKKLHPTYDGWPDSKKIEHVADAVGAAHASFKDPTVMVMVRKLRAGA